MSDAIVPNLKQIAESLHIDYNANSPVSHFPATLKQVRDMYILAHPESIISKLPDSYDRLEYIQCSGTQHIDTGCYPTSSTKIVADFEASGVFSGYAGLFGSRQQQASKTFCVFLGSTDLIVQVGDVRSSSYKPPWSGANKRMQYILDRNTFTYGQQKITLPKVTYSGASTSSILILALKTGNAVDSRKVKGKLYSSRIYENDVLIRNFIPAKNKSTNQIGLYDNVNDVFYTNSGSGNFTAGPIITYSDNPSIYTRCLNNNQFTILRQNEIRYKELEYIQFNGNQFINTNVGSTNATRVLTKIFLDTNQPSAISDAVSIFGNRSTDSSRNFSLWKINKNAFRADYGNTRQYINLIPEGDFEIDFNKNIVNINDTQTILNSSLGEFSTNDLLRIASNYNRVADYSENLNDARRFSGKLYYFKIYNQNNLIRDFIPAKRVNDSAIGLYDNVENVFYLNEGSDSFGEGPEIGYI